MVVFARPAALAGEAWPGRDCSLRRIQFASLLVPVVLAIGTGPAPALAQAAPGVGSIPQGTQSNTSYAHSYARYGVTNVSATTQKVSCYRPEVPFFTVGKDP